MGTSMYPAWQWLADNLLSKEQAVGDEGGGWGEAERECVCV